MRQTFKEPFRVRWQDADIKGKAKLSAICNYCQETAGRHAGQMGFGYADALSRDQLWVLVGMYLKMYEFPKWDEDLVVETWPVKTHRLFAFRDYRLYNNSDKIIGTASSSWMVLHVKTRRPQALEIVKDIDGTVREDEHSLPDPPTLDHLAGGTSIFTHKVLYNDLDFNGHVNSNRYVDLCMDTYSREHHEVMQADTFAINYLMEVYAEDSIILLKGGAPGQEDLVEGQRNSDGRIAFRARTTWRPTAP